MVAIPDEVQLLQKAGFTIESTMKEEAINNGNYVDVIRLSITINNCSNGYISNSLLWYNTA